MHRITKGTNYNKVQLSSIKFVIQYEMGFLINASDPNLLAGLITAIISRGDEYKSILEGL